MRKGGEKMKNVFNLEILDLLLNLQYIGGNFFLSSFIYFPTSADYSAKKYIYFPSLPNPL